jgi:hypothetical protein
MPLLHKALKTLQSLLLETKAAHGASMTSLIATLQSLFTYGFVHSNNGVTISINNQHPLPLSPLPPLPRRSTELPPPTTTTANGTSVLYSSDSELSDGEGGGSSSLGGAGDRYISPVRVRSSALACLQCLAKIDAKALHSTWTTLLPMTASFFSPSASSLLVMMSRSSPATLIHVLLQDPNARVRHSAAVAITTLLEGPAQRKYLSLGEVEEAVNRAGGGGFGKTNEHRQRGFLTLSISLGKVIIATHSGLLKCIRNEKDMIVVAAALRALGTLHLGCDHQRLPSELLKMVFESVCIMLLVPATNSTINVINDNNNYSGYIVATMKNAHIQNGEGLHGVVLGALGCLAAVVGVTPPSPLLRAYLLQSSKTAATTTDTDTENGLQEAGTKYSLTLMNVLPLLARCDKPTLAMEALLIMRGIIQQYWSSMGPMKAAWWKAVVDIVTQYCTATATTTYSKHNNNNKNNSNNNSNSTKADGQSSSVEKVGQQAVRLLADFLEKLQQQEEENSLHCSLVLVDCWVEATTKVVLPALTTTPTGLPLPLAGIKGAVWSLVSLLPPCLDWTENHQTPHHRSLLSCEQLICAAISTIQTDATSAVRGYAVKAAPVLYQLTPSSTMVAELIEAVVNTALLDPISAVRTQAASSLVSIASIMMHDNKQLNINNKSNGAAGADTTNAIDDQQQQQVATATATAVVKVLIKAGVNLGNHKDGKLHDYGMQILALTIPLVTVHNNDASDEDSSLKVLVEESQRLVEKILRDEGSSGRTQWSACRAGQSFLKQSNKSSNSSNSKIAMLLGKLAVSSKSYKTRLLAAKALCSGSSVGAYGDVVVVDGVMDILRSRRGDDCGGGEGDGGREEIKQMAEEELEAAMEHLLALKMKEGVLC